MEKIGRRNTKNIVNMNWSEVIKLGILLKIVDEHGEEILIDNLTSNGIQILKGEINQLQERINEL